MPFRNFPYILSLPTERKATDILACNSLNISRLFCGVRGILSAKATCVGYEPLVLIPLTLDCGVRGIRTPETLLTFTRFPGVPLQPLEHHSG